MHFYDESKEIVRVVCGLLRSVTDYDTILQVKHSEGNPVERDIIRKLHPHGYACN